MAAANWRRAPPRRYLLPPGVAALNGLPVRAAARLGPAAALAMMRAEDGISKLECPRGKPAGQDRSAGLLRPKEKLALVVV
jgi:hypothetical protein